MSAPLRPLGCSAVAQLAADAPTASFVATHAARLRERLPVRLLTRPSGWPAVLTTLLGHTDAVNSVALSRDGSTAVSASKDKTLR